MIALEPADLAGVRPFRDAVGRLPGVVVTGGHGDWFLFHDPDAVTDPERRFPFCTIVTGDRYDAASRLDRDEATYRVNLGVSRQSYERHFGPAPRQAVGHEVIETGADYTATDTLLPHPFYAPMHWVCVVNPGERTRTELSRLLDESHDAARRAYEKQRRRRG